MKRKFLAFALVAMLLTTCLLPSATAFAGEESETVISYDGFITGTTPYGSKIIENYPTLVKLEYLERIEGTPFATLKTKKITIPLTFHLNPTGSKVIDTGSLSINDFLDAMNLSSFGVLQSYVKEFDYKGVDLIDGIPVFRAVYYETYYLNSKTADDCFENFYIDCNISFSEFYTKERLVSYDDKSDKDNPVKKTFELATERDVEVFANSIYSAYPEQLGTYTLDEIYGYWSLVSIPKSYTFNGFFSEIGGGTFKPDGVITFATQQSLSAREIKILQEDYNMSGLSRFLNFLGKLFSPDKDYVVWCYMLYVDGGDTELLITQNGSNTLESTQGAVVNGTVDFLESLDLGEGVAEFWAIVLVMALLLIIFVIVIKAIKRKKKK